MWEKNLGRRLLLIAGVLGFGIFMLATKPLKPGIDIAGGHAMIFEIDDTGLDEPTRATLAETMKTLLQQRVDPQGVLNLTWRVVGRNRIEVQMPLPPADAKARQEAYQAALDKLFKSNVTRGDLEAIFRLPPDQRQEAAAQVARGDAKRQELILAAAQRYDAYQKALSTLRDARAGETSPGTGGQGSNGTNGTNGASGHAQDAPEAPATQPTEQAGDQPAATQEAATQPADAPAAQEPPREPTVDDLELEVRDAEEYLQDAIDAVLGTNIAPRRFQETLELDTKSPVRENTLKQLRAEHPGLVPEINEAVSRFADWREKRGYLDGPADLQRLLRGAGQLDFRILVEPDAQNPTRFDNFRRQLDESGPRPRPNDTMGWFRIDNPVAFFNLDSPADLEGLEPERHPRISSVFVAARRGDDFYVLAHLDERNGLLARGDTPWKLKSAGASRDELGRPSVIFTFDPAGGKLFHRLTAANVENQLCILLDDVAYSSANIRSAIGQSGTIEGDFSTSKVQYLVQTMQAGALPARLKDTPLSERTIEAKLGQSNLEHAFKAGLIGIIVVCAFMMIYYFMGGMIANAALLMNVVLVLAALAMLGARLTLDGIAGVILTIGMSVDANVLIFERMREEKERGASLRMIVKNGYDKAFSTIFDANITTLLTCLIIYYLGSEEIKGFGLTLGWGIVISLFTALFVTRTLFTLLIKYNVLKEIRMLKLIGVPRIDWYAKRKIFVPISIALTLGGLASIFVRSPKDLFDVEFLGGINAVFETVRPTDADKIQDGISKVGREIAQQADQLANTQVSDDPGPGQYLVSIPGVSAERTAAMIAEPLDDILERGGVDDTVGGERVSVRVKEAVTAEQLAARIKDLAQDTRSAGSDIADARVNAVLETGGAEDMTGRVWNVVTRATNKRLVQQALVQAVGDNLSIRPRVSYEIGGEGGYPIQQARLEEVIPGLPQNAGGDVSDYMGGVAFYFQDMNPPRSLESLRQRFKNMRLQPGYEDYGWRDFEVIGVTPAEQGQAGQPLYSGVVLVVSDPAYSYFASEESWRTELAEKELSLAEAALGTEQSLQKVTQFKPQVANQAKQRGLLALAFSWIAIIGYVWVRFGTAMYGIAGVVALVHDVAMALAFVAFSGLIGGPGHPGQLLLINDFKIDMTILAAFLTIIGFSINDTIVIFDRIRETRGRLGKLTPEIINNSINQCMSRTILTSLTTFFVLAVMYIFGGESIRGFNYCMMIGIITGTYSSVAIAAPLLMLSKKAEPVRATAAA